jgi:hypothetical protein
MLAMDFMFSQNFRTLSVEDIERASEVVRTIFYGVNTLWGILPQDIAERKREICYQYLTAWQLAVWYPNKTTGIANNGGLPLKSKFIRNIRLIFENVTRQGSSLTELQSNVFGIQALQMIQNAPENFMLFR